MIKKTLIVGFKFPHHSANGGYDELVNHVSGFYLNADKLLFGKAKFGSPKRKVNMILVELLTIIYGLFYKKIFFFYSEQCLGIANYVLKALGKQIVIAVHLDQKFWFSNEQSIRTNLRRMVLNRADCIICLSSAQQLFFKSIFPKKEIRFIRHGYTFQVKEKLKKTENGKIVCVGENYRDFALLKQIEATLPNILILIGASHCDITGWKNTLKSNRLTDTEYQVLLEGSIVGLLPLTFATANNALFEYIDNGVLPIISNIEGVCDYYIGGMILCNNANEFRYAISRAYEMNNTDYTCLVRKIRREAIQCFSWEVVGSQIDALLA